jgi:lysozyme family protein
MADFSKAFSIILKNEGGYVNDPKDSGGETYRGISRRWFPNWKGWNIIDIYKKDKKLNNKNLSENKELTNYVSSFYKKEFWDKIWGDKISNQKVANLLLDSSVNIGISNAVKMSQKSFSLSENGEMDNMLLKKLNSVVG